MQKQNNMINWHTISQFIKYQLKSRHVNGHGVHSPFVFEFIREVLYQNASYYKLENINSVRKKYASNRQLLKNSDLGAGKRIFKTSTQNKVCDIAATGVINKKYGEVLFRMMTRFKPRTIIELGTSLGMSTLYLSLPNQQTKVYSIEGNTELCLIAKNTFNELNIKNIQLINGLFDVELPLLLNEVETVDLVFFDGNHKKEATLNYFNQCLNKTNNETIFIFDDIHWSPEMTEAWKIICQHPQITVSMDLFQMGIVFFRKECKKQHFTVRF